VFKVELPKIGDPMRSMLAYPDGRSPIWLNEARNKKQEIYGDFLGLEQDEIDELKNKGVI